MNERQIVYGAVIASFLLHLIVVAATWRLPFMPQPDDAMAQAFTDEMELYLVPVGDEDVLEAEAQLPKTYTSVPERLASLEPPESQETLAMHHSLAADMVEGGDGNAPAAAEEWLFPQNAVRREDLLVEGGAAYAPEPFQNPQDGRQNRDRGGQEQNPSSIENPDLDTGEMPLPELNSDNRREGDEEGVDEIDNNQADLDDWIGGEAPTILREGEEYSYGDRGFEFDQAELGEMGSGVAIDGDFSLSTYEWDYAPWIKRFGNELHRHWMSPYAYKLGVISGKTIIKMVVEKDGRPSSLEVLQADGHESLHDASLAALNAFAPYAPLPAHFPEEKLVIILGLHYPAWRH